MKRNLLFLLPLFAVGCSSSGGDMSKTDESTLKTNLTRGLTKEEMSQMGASKTKAPNDKL